MADGDDQHSPRVTVQVDEDYYDEAAGSAKRRSIQYRGRGVSRLEEKHAKVNTLFGFTPFANHIAKRPLEERSERVRSLYIPSSKPAEQERFMSVGNVLWAISFGWVFYLLYAFVSLLLFVTVVGAPYARLCWRLKNYFLWPFGKFLVKFQQSSNGAPNEGTKLLGDGSVADLPIYMKAPESGPAHIAALVAWYIFGFPFLFLHHVISMSFCWMGVISIPMAKANMAAVRMLLKQPLKYSVTERFPGPGFEVMSCTYNSVNLYYYKYHVGGMNIVLVNMLAFVVLTLILGYAPIPKSHKPPPLVTFFLALLSIIPLSYYLGMAVSSISAQSSFGIGAVLNATFGSVIEIILYATAIAKGSLTEFVHSGITGALLATLLLLPGLAMIAGGIKYKEQRFNTAAAGVSNILLIICVVGAFTPTIFYLGWGGYTLECQYCTPTDLATNSSSLHCVGCSYEEVQMGEAYNKGAKPLMYAVSALLPIAYIVGLIFTLKTHSHIYEDDEGGEGEGEDAPEWGRPLCLAILIAGTIAFSFVTDTLLDALEPSLETLGLKQSFVGVFFIGIISNTAEIINAVNFALRDNIALSIEIGYAGTIQASLIQMPFLVIFSAIINRTHGVQFSLIFPVLNLFAIFLGVMIVNYISNNGKTNYFEGTALVIVYALFMCAFLFVPQ